MAKPDAALLDPARFRCVHEVTTRFADLDPNGHINNVAMAAVFEDGRVRFIQSAGFREALGEMRFMVVSVGIDYLAQAHFPHPLTCHTAALAVGLTRPAQASTFVCYVGTAPDGPVVLRKRPNDQAKAVRPLDQFDMVTDVSGVRERDGWVYVIWSKSMISSTNFRPNQGDGRGWIKRDQIRGECAD